MRKGHKITKVVVAIVLATMVLAVASACSMGSTAPDQVGLHYHAGSLSSTKYANCISQGTRKWSGPSDKYYYYPAGQRSFDFSTARDADAPPITVVSKDNQELVVNGGLTFYLDTNCDAVDLNGHHYKGGMLQAFHQNLGIKFKAYMSGDNTSEGWQHLLAFYMGKPLTNAMQNEAQKYTWLQLYNDPAVRTQFDNAVKAALPAAVKAQTGGSEFFDNFNLIVQKPEPDKRLVAALAAVQQQIVLKQAVDASNLTVDAELNQIKKLTAVLGPYGYVLYKAIKDCEDGKAACPAFLPVPSGTNLQIPAGASK